MAENAKCPCGSMLLPQEVEKKLCSICVEEKDSEQLAADESTLVCIFCSDVFAEEEVKGDKCPGCGEDDGLIEQDYDPGTFDPTSREEQLARLKDKRNR